MATPPGFYNPVDQAIYSAGDFFIPQERFRAAPYNVNAPAEDDPAAAGIAAVYKPQGGGGGGYTGGISDLTTSFQTAVDNRQDRLRSLNMPLEQKGVPGGDILMENIGAPGIEDIMGGNFAEFGPVTIKGASGVYSAGAKPTINRRIQDAFYSLPFLSKPQSADQIIAEGYTGQSNMPGIMSMVLGSMDKYGELPRGDQAFIARNMGYTGPTVFGENASGLGKDPFGLNVRSGFGNYAERVGKEYSSLGDSLSGRLAEKYGVEFDPVTGTFVGTNAAKANQMTKMMRAKYNFYKQQTAQRDADRKAAEEARMKAYQESQMKQERDRIQSSLDSGGYDSTSSRPDRDRGSVTAASAAASKGVGGGGYTASDSNRDAARGRYMMGGLADLVDIYD